MIPIRIPWTSQPPAGTPIDWSNPLTRGLVFAKNHAGRLAPESGPHQMPLHSDTDYGELRFEAGRGGIARAFKATDTNVDYGWDTTGLPAPTDQLTALAFVQLNATGDNSEQVFGQTRSGFAEWGIQWYTSTPHLAFEIRTDTSGFVQAYNPLTKDTNPHVMIGRYDGAQAEMWADGTRLNFAAATGNITEQGTYPIIINGTWTGSLISGAPTNMSHYLNVLWHRALNDAELKALSKNPWQIFEPRTIYVPYTAAATTPGLLPVKVPWTSQPQNITELSYSHPFKPIFGIVPGWFPQSGTGSLIVGSVRSIGQRSPVFTWENFNGNTANTTSVKSVPYINGRSARVVSHRDLSANTTNGYRLVSEAMSDNFPGALDNFTCVAIFRPQGDGGNGVSDPRIFTKDQGGATDDHDLMVGATKGTNMVPRTRVRIGSSTITVVPSDTSGNAIQSDAWNLTATVVQGNSVNLKHWREDGTYVSASGSGTGSFNPRTGLKAAMFATAGANFNQTSGDLLGVFILNAPLTADELWDLFQNPWQIFEPRTIWVPYEVAAASNALMPVKVPYQGPNGFTYDFRQGPVGKTLTATAGVYERFGYLATDSGDDLKIYSGLGLGLDVWASNTDPHIEIDPSKTFRMEKHQFCEGEFTALTSGAQWIGPAVFIGGDTASGGTGADNCYMVLHAGSGVWRLYKKQSSTFSLLTNITSVDLFGNKVRVRIEALERSDAVELRWWINGIEGTPYTDTTTTRVTHKSTMSNRGAAQGTAFGVNFGNGASGERYAMWIRGGNMPERKTRTIWIPVQGVDTAEPPVTLLKKFLTLLGVG